MSMKGEIVWRIGMVYILMMLVAALIVVKALHVQMWEGEKWRSKSGSVRVKDFEVTVDFDGFGIKKMFASFAQLQRL